MNEPPTDTQHATDFAQREFRVVDVITRAEIDHYIETRRIERKRAGITYDKFCRQILLPAAALGKLQRGELYLGDARSALARYLFPPVGREHTNSRDAAARRHARNLFQEFATRSQLGAGAAIPESQDASAPHFGTAGSRTACTAWMQLVGCSALDHRNTTASRTSQHRASRRQPARHFDIASGQPSCQRFAARCTSSTKCSTTTIAPARAPRYGSRC